MADTEIKKDRKLKCPVCGSTYIINRNLERYLKQEESEELDALVRDACSATPVSKSEYQERLLAWRDRAVKEAISKHVAAIKGIRNGIKANGFQDTADAIDDILTQLTRKGKV